MDALSIKQTTAGPIGRVTACYYGFVTEGPNNDKAVSTRC